MVTVHLPGLLSTEQSPAPPIAPISFVPCKLMYNTSRTSAHIAILYQHDDYCVLHINSKSMILEHCLALDFLPSLSACSHALSSIAWLSPARVTSDLHLHLHLSQ
jgi:hypothetical protein